MTRPPRFGSSKAALILEEEIKGNSKLSRKVGKILSDFNRAMNFLFESFENSLLDQRVTLKIVKYLSYVTYNDWKNRITTGLTLGDAQQNVKTLVKNVIHASHGALLEDLRWLVKTRKRG